MTLRQFRRRSELFKQGLHIWSGVAAVNSTVLHLPAISCAGCADDPALGDRIIEGLTFKGQCYSALRRCSARVPDGKAGAAVVHLMNLYGVEEHDGHVDCRVISPTPIGAHDGVTRQSVTISLKRFTELESCTRTAQPRDPECGHAWAIFATVSIAKSVPSTISHDG